MRINHFSPCVCMFCNYNACYEELPICSDCARRFYSMMRAPCKSCGKAAFECDCPNGDGYKFLFFFGSYDSKVAIYSVKNLNDKREIAFFADMMIYSAGITAKRFDVVTYIPRRKRAILRQGGDQAKALAKAISKKTGIPMVTLLKRKGKRQQKLLDYSDRKKNIKDTYSLKYIPNEKYKKVLLVDDIITTGATLKGCAEILRQDAARAVVPVAIAKTNFALRKQFDF